MTTTTNVENLPQYKSRFLLIKEQMLAFASGTNWIAKVKNLSPNFKRIPEWCFTLYIIILFRIDRSIFALIISTNNHI